MPGCCGPWGASGRTGEELEAGVEDLVASGDKRVGTGVGCTLVIGGTLDAAAAAGRADMVPEAGFGVGAWGTGVVICG